MDVFSVVSCFNALLRNDDSFFHGPGFGIKISRKTWEAFSTMRGSHQHMLARL